MNAFADPPEGLTDQMFFLNVMCVQVLSDVLITWDDSEMIKKPHWWKRNGMLKRITEVAVNEFNPFVPSGMNAEEIYPSIERTRAYLLCGILDRGSLQSTLEAIANCNRTREEMKEAAIRFRIRAINLGAQEFGNYVQQTGIMMSFLGMYALSNPEFGGFRPDFLMDVAKLLHSEERSTVGHAAEETPCFEAGQWFT
ncbi:expressed unknown protein [Seminavis robusta]|uniref:Uncharacterized protein n=1 Tax=Seminavis robusta TaxID=568900 RepID=A0A9N8HGC2_9STRA|nr:expressed unknown protein [Seminavis robusta]|eukprot:Sro477_g150730.1 n/a (197) ;mRNA; r:18509-19099